MASTTTLFEQAFDHHRAGEIEPAVKLYREVLRIDPRHADGLHLLGVAALQQKQYPSAVESIRRAIAEKADRPLYYSNLGAAYREMGNLDEAIRSFHEAIRLSPGLAGAHYNLGLALACIGQHEEAVAALREAVRHDSQFTDAWSSLGSALAACGRHTDAIDCFDRALEIDPAAADVTYNRANALCALGRFDEAIADYRAAIERTPGRFELWNNLGTALKESGRFADALAALRRSLILAPTSAETYNNLGAVYQFQGAGPIAADCYRQAIALDPGLCAAHTNLGNVAADRGQAKTAIAHYEQVLEIDPTSAEANYNRSLELIRSGRWTEGWNSYHWRWKRNVLRRKIPGPEWNGEDLSTRTILVYAEQGIGDEIMFASCLPEVIERSRACLIECDPRLVGLLGRSFPRATVVARPLPIDDAGGSPRFDVHAAMGSLPKFFRTDEAEFPCRGGYLSVDVDAVEQWRTRFDELGESLRIGLSWRGGAEPDARRKRSTRLEQWQPILSLPGITFVNLQYGDCRDDLAGVKSALGVTVHDWPDADPLTDLDNFADQIAALDLVISVDNSTVHMAGALGTPAWTLLPVASDWRWMLDREDSPWYPSMRLFRQSTPGNWDNVFARLVRELCTRFSPREGSGNHTRRAITVDGSAADSQFRRGNALLAEGSPAEALPCYQRAVLLRPGEADYRINLANTCVALGKIDEAIESYEWALKLDSRYDAEIHINLGHVLKSRGRFAEALAHYEFARGHRPASGELPASLGFVLQALGRKPDAEREYRRALELDPKCADAHNNLATLLHENRQLDDAAEHYRQAIRLQGDSADTRCNLGLLLTEQRQLDEAADSFDCALALAPDHVEAKFYRGVLRLLRGNFSGGWPDYDCRWQRETTQSQRLEIPHWTGTPLTVERLLIYAEQGVGDQVLFASCLPDVLERASRCVVECDARLVPLFSRSFPAARIVPEPSRGQPRDTSLLNETDFAVAVGDLPGLFRLSENAFPRHNGYLVPQATFCRHWRDRLADMGPGPKIGISWRGGCDPEDRQRRSTRLDQWAAVFDALPEAVFVNLQYGETADEVRAVKSKHAARLYDCPRADSLEDLDQFAALLSSLDLVVTVDNTTAHLAGALSVPVWTLLQFASEWRWLITRDDSPWYPSMRLFRQSASGHWDDVLRSVRQKLRTRFLPRKQSRRKASRPRMNIR